MTAAKVATLTEFLLARIAEDEAATRTAKPGPWHWEGEQGHHGSWRLVTADPEPESPHGQPYDGALWDSYVSAAARRTVADGTACDDYGAQVDIEDADAEHIARWDPARVLAECEAKRRIVEELDEAITYDESIREGLSSTAAAGERVLNYLALPYADHPDYDQGWRP